MVNAIFCAHGKLACAMLESVQMVYGDANVAPWHLSPEKTPATSWKS
jgi:mannose/fructose-specific phosphotransferase system component IIA